MKLFDNFHNYIRNKNVIIFISCLNLLKLSLIKHPFDFFFENYHEFFDIFRINKLLLILL